MKLKPIIRSLLDTDFYKFTMGLVIYHQFPTYTTKWAFKCRNKDVVFTDEMIKEIKDQIKYYCNLKFTEDELDYLKSIKWLKSAYIDFLRLWHPNENEITITKVNSGCGMEIISYGSWVNVSMYEIPILAIVNEVYFRFKYADKYEELRAEQSRRIDEKIASLNNLKYQVGTFSEFGTRRRFNLEGQRELIMKMLNAQDDEKLIGGTFIGTSNVMLAKELDCKPVGTQAHEMFMGFQGNPKINPAYSNWYCLDSWVKEYGVLNGIALTDTLGTDLFLKDFQLTFATLFNGVRHDSGDPFEWGEKMIKHYESLGIDPKTKTLLFSDSLDFERATKLNLHFRNRINVAFGIGTWLANDVGVEPLNIVMKMIECNERPVAKLSNNPEKCMCRDNEYIDYLNRTIDWRMNH